MKAWIQELCTFLLRPVTIQNWGENGSREIRGNRAVPRGIIERGGSDRPVSQLRPLNSCASLLTVARLPALSKSSVWSDELPAESRSTTLFTGL